MLRDPILKKNLLKSVLAGPVNNVWAHTKNAQDSTNANAFVSKPMLNVTLLLRGQQWQRKRRGTQ